VRTARAAVVLWTALLVCAAVIPADRVPLPADSDLWAHGIGYGLHAFLTCLAVREGRPGIRAAVVAVGAAIALGAATEVLQGFVPGRQPSLADVLADAIGGLVGAATGWSVIGRREDP